MLTKGGGGYIDKVKALNPIVYFPLYEASGSTIEDLSGSDLDGSYTGVILGQTGIGDGNTSPLFDGANDYGDIYTVGFKDAFDGGEGTAAVWVRVYDASVWTDGDNVRRFFILKASSTNFIRCRKTGNNQIGWEYRANNVTESVLKGSMTTTDWFHMAMIWSATADEVKYYYDGVQEGTTDTTLGVWAGDLGENTTLLGASSKTPAAIWHGYLAHFAVWDSALTAAQIATLAVT
jgi:hypothetical protein